MKKSEQKIIIFDLDETLIHATENKLDFQEDFIHDKYFVYKRPYLEEFLKKCSQYFTIGIWSSADDDYVHSIAEKLTNNEVNFKLVWGRSECWLKIIKTEDELTGLKRKEYQSIKPLEKIRKKGFKIRNLLIVDDSEYKVINNPENYIIIDPFTGNQNDNELKHLLEFLIKSYKLNFDFRDKKIKNWKENTTHNIS